MKVIMRSVCRSVNRSIILEPLEGFAEFFHNTARKLWKPDFETKILVLRISRGGQYYGVGQDCKFSFLFFPQKRPNRENFLRSHKEKTRHNRN